MACSSGIVIFHSYRKCLIGLCLMVFMWIAINSEAMLLSKPYRVVRDTERHVFCEIHRVNDPAGLPSLFRQKGELAIVDYSDFLKLFHRINPGIQNIDAIQPGQEILIPLRFVSSDIYPDLTDGFVTLPLVTISEAGVTPSTDETREYVVQPGDNLSTILMRFHGKSRLQELLKRFQIQNPLVTDINRIYPGQRITISLTQPAPSQQRPAKIENPFQQAANVLHAKLFQTGDFFFPGDGLPDFQLDLKQFPMMDLRDGYRILFNLDRGIPSAELLTIERYWPNLFTIDLPLPTDMNRILQAIQARIRPTLPEMYHEKISVPPALATGDKIPGRIICIHANTRKRFVEAIISSLGLAWHPRVEISFPYAGVQITTLANLIDIPDGMPVVFDFGHFSGDAEAALQSSGFNLAPIQHSDTETVVIEKLFIAINKSRSPSITIHPYPANPSGLPGFQILRSNFPDKLVLMEHLDQNAANALIQDGLELIVPPHVQKGSLCATNLF